ncbi:hypothetical protein LUZ63_020997 [Rhynchospora breviuscula]|uniref:Membrane-anchored protein n=1 Tax=Rhynchospora breviuscula TaxID=2022672 RepID=A0A9Q0C0H1_9POAL|nr:hypothetical protein LUZ63_020997 [Rhynchospora breviuscula]
MTPLTDDRPPGPARRGAPLQTSREAGSWTRTVLTKVPEVTLLFWLVKILSTTVGETAADFLNANVGLGLGATTALMSVLFVAVLVWQVSLRRYVPGVYWLTVVLVSVVGTLFSDNLVDNLGVSLYVSTALFAVCLAVAFTAWYRGEGTLSIHTITTRRREAYYWAAILFTFALGTSAGDLISEKLALGYVTAAVIFGAVIALIALSHYVLRVDAVLAFWAAYVVTRPFGASIGDLLTAPHGAGGLALGTNGTSAIFLVVIVAVVSWFTVQQRRAGRAGRAARPV